MTLDDVIDRMVRGETLQQVAPKYGASPRTLRRMVRSRYGASPQSVVVIRRRAIATSMLAAGATLQAVCARLNVHRTTVWRLTRGTP